eukprot:gene57041-76168_t
MLLFGALGALTTVPILTALQHTTSPVLAFVLIIVALAIVSFYTSISGIVKAEMFPPEVRALGVGLAYAVANAIFGGSAEYVALGLKSLGHESAFFWYVSAMMVLAFVVSLRLPRQTRSEGTYFRLLEERGMKSKLETAIVCGGAVLVYGALIGVFAAYPPAATGDWAAWAQAFGSVTAIGLGLWVVQRQHTLEMQRREARKVAARLSMHQGALQLINAVYAVAEKVKSHPDESALDLLHLSLE